MFLACIVVLCNIAAQLVLTDYEMNANKQDPVYLVTKITVVSHTHTNTQTQMYTCSSNNQKEYSLLICL